HQPLTGRFLQAKAINPECSLRGRYLASLRATLAPYPWQQVILDALFPPTEEVNWQKVAAAVALTRRISVISGGPGTGKTTTV
ncbi:hypothetical protein MJN47_32500, partial [Salmonella enterica subsp. enterica serovar Lubbock]|nr:hypothetical protein [Salmonella enterica subsp. enterica serovar Lubbock]